MSSSIKAALLLSLACTLASAAPPMPGRPATPQELAAWDTDVRADFSGLPKGSGSVASGQQVWEGKCASCHGTFGESNEVFTPIVGGTTAQDIASGRVAALKGGVQPHKTTLMKLSTVSTLFDYIRRAMPWTAPKSLSVDEVYGVTAYILNLGEIVPEDFVLSDRNIAQVQQRIPNRNGMQREHGLWDVKGKPDVTSVACMRHCDPQAALHSSLPEAARNAHGNLALQQRDYGPTRGIASGAPAAAASALSLAQSNACLGCHAVNDKLVGPAFTAVAARYKERSDAAALLSAKIRQGGFGNWGELPMPAQTQLRDADLNTIVQWLLAGAKP